MEPLTVIFLQSFTLGTGVTLPALVRIQSWAGIAAGREGREPAAKSIGNDVVRVGDQCWTILIRECAVDPGAIRSRARSVKGELIKVVDLVFGGDSKQYMAVELPIDEILDTLARGTKRSPCFGMTCDSFEDVRVGQMVERSIRVQYGSSSTGV